MEKYNIDLQAQISSIFYWKQICGEKYGQVRSAVTNPKSAGKNHSGYIISPQI